MHDPLAQTPTPTLEPKEARIVSRVPGSFAEKRICILGDNALLTYDLAMQLRFAGYTIVVATQVEQLMPLSAELPFTCILVDPSSRSSPFADPACVAQIRSQFNNPVPIVWLAVRNNFESRQAAVRAGVDAYLAKPIEISALTECIESLIQYTESQTYRVLVVASDASRLSVIGGVLEKAGMETICLKKPCDLVATLCQQHPEAIVIDVHTPACDGADLTKLIRQDKAFLDLPIVVLSEDKSHDMRQRAMSAGVDEFLPNTVPPEDLVFSVSCRVERSRALRSLIIRDGLTGLYNHVSIKEQLVREIVRSRREKSPLALGMLDIDRFKTINDSYGHPVGDQVIRAMSKMLKQRLRRDDIVGRYGGEEFAVILPVTSASVAADVLNEIRETFAKIPHRADDKSFFATFSAGVTELNDATGPSDAGEMFYVADAALYKAKQGGRNRVVMG